ncbi:hypothetical protein EWM64_g590 [Hericium alpestre]|uniref:Major facilitator superfamily (MFS) profile domain-containing protein n=1 Tax=Hericium alpestre TaxID=135208 RepID=A0A4Z0A9M6_9AGAM|nr:hypothetical protein EWM64_g590 [Hericium alpestre]
MSSPGDRQPATADLSDQEKALSVDDSPDAPIDIEHAAVADDPREWSFFQKSVVLFIVASASLIAGLASNIYNPAINQIIQELHATSGEISLSLSLFILFQGVVPLLWSALSELRGRKIVYVTSIAISVVGCIVAAEAHSIGVLIGMRCLQAVGSSAVMAIGAATLADIYEPAERGKMMGIYYAAPQLGPSLGPIVGGVLTQLLSWRATFWFLVIFMSCTLVMFTFFFRDTYRRERSLVYQAVLRRNLKQRARLWNSSKSSSKTEVCPEEDKKAPLPLVTEANLDITETSSPPSPTLEVRMSIRDVNPFPTQILLLRRWNNVVILIASGLLWGYAYTVLYTCALTLENDYHYNSLKTGLVLLAYGIGCMAGSILGGRWSDHVLRRMKEKNGGRMHPEMRLEATKCIMPFFPISAIAYGWLAEKHVHIAAVCVALFFSGFFSIWIYSSTLAYIVDANNGRSSSAVATNSCFRGTTAFVFAEIAVPLRNAMGEGGLYSLWTGLIIICEILVLLVLYKGGAWREKGEARERARA